MRNAFWAAQKEKGSLVANQSTLSAVTLIVDNGTELLAPTRRTEEGRRKRWKECKVIKMDTKKDTNRQKKK